MSVIQTTYPNFHDALVEGQIANTQTCDVSSFQLADGSTAVGFGKPVQRGSDDGQCVPGVGRAQVALLDAAMTNSTTTLSFDNARGNGFRIGQYIVVDTEIMHISAVAANLTVARGQLGSSAAAHSNNDEVYALDEVLLAGITVMDERLPAADGVEFTAGQQVPVIIRGSVVVKATAAVSAGDQVVVTTVAGTGANAADVLYGFSSRAVDGTHIAIPNAVFETSAAADGLAVVRIAGVAPTFS